ncbi:MAG: Ig-like domain-containing protein, partial [Dehalococcoidales bacterium]
YFTGDGNNNNTATLEYRTPGGAWKTAPAMYKDTRATVTTGSKSQANPYLNTYRGSIFWLTTNTAYEVRVTFSDTDGVSGGNPVTGTVTTWNDNPPSNGSSYYVSPSGSDNNAGTEASPFKTIAKAASVAAAGSTVYFKAGTYNSGTTLTTSGTPANYITFRNYGSDKPVFTASIWVQAAYIRIKGLTFQNTPNTCIDVSGENMPAGSVTGDIVEDCIFINPALSNSDSAVRVDYGAQNVIIQRNSFTINFNDHEDKDGVYWWYPGDGIVCRNNTVTGTPWDGFGGGPENQFGYINNNDFYNNYISGAIDDGIQPDGDNLNTRVYNNVITNTFAGVSSCPVAIGPEYIFRNSISGLHYRNEAGDNEAFKLGDSSTGRIYFYHNTVYTTDLSDGAAATNGGLANVISRNNIYHVGWYVLEFGHYADAVNCNFDYDNLYTTRTDDRYVKWGEAKYSTLEAFIAGAGQEAHGMNISVTSELVNAAGDDLHLKAGSQFIDKGEVLPGFNDANSPWPYSGAAPDLGAFEYGSGGTSSNTAPVAANDSYNIYKDNVLNMPAPGVLSNDADANGDALTSALVSNVSHGALTLNSNGSFTYTPASGYTGTDSFSYRANDGKVNSNTATVTITISTPVNTAPVAVNDAYTTNKDTALVVSAPGVLANDTDINGDALTAVLAGNVSHGTLALNSSGAFVYTPASGYTGTDSFTYRASDGKANSNIAAVTITVNTAANTAPVASGDAYTTGKATTLIVSVPGVLANDTDANGDALTAFLTRNVYHGSLILNSNGSFTYTPYSSYTGTDSFTYRASDGKANSNTAMVTITITTPSNNAPVAVNNAYSADRNTALLVAAPGILANDTDANGDTLTAALTGSVSHGTLALNSNGSFTYTPATGYTGTDSFTYRANDGKTNSNTATVTINVKEPESGGGGGGGGGGGAMPGTIDISSMVNSTGQISQDVTVSSADNNVTLTVSKDTVALSVWGQPIYYLSVLESAYLAPPSSGDIISKVYNLGPSGTTFDRGITLTFKYDETIIPPGVAEEHLVISSWQSGEGWVDLPSIVDTVNNTITVQVNHFSEFAVLAYVRPANIQVSSVTVTPQECEFGNNVDIYVSIANAGDLAAEYEIMLYLDGVLAQTSAIALEGSSQATVIFSVTPGTAGEHQINIGGMTAGFTVQTPKAPAAFHPVTLNINPARVSPGDTVSIGLLVANSGDIPGIYVASLVIDGVVLEVKDISITAGNSATVSFSLASAGIGEHQVQIGGLTGAFTVTAPPPVDEPQVKLNDFSVTPLYETESGRLVSAAVMYQVDQPPAIVDINLVLKVFLDGALLETCPVLKTGQTIAPNGIGEVDYLPSAGWAVGEYSFALELSSGGSIVQTTPSQYLEVLSDEVNRPAGWKVPAITVGVTIPMMLLTILVLRRRQDSFSLGGEE